MRLKIDAWLERKDPYLRVFDADTGRELVRWEVTQLRDMLDRGEICLADIDEENLLSLTPQAMLYVT